MKRKLCALLLLCATLLCILPVNAADLHEGIGKSEVPYGPSRPGVQAVGYDAKVFNMMTAAEAAKAGVPAGYTGDYVLALTGPAASHVGFMLDRRVKHSLVRSFTMRVWCPTCIREIRITDNAGASWIARLAPEKKNAWIEVTFSPTSDNYADGHDFDAFLGGDGYFKPVNVGFRFENTAPQTTVYIDRVTFDVKEADTAAPVIRYDGETTILTSAGKPFVFAGTAYDAFEDRDIDLTYTWSAGALDPDGRLTEGTHTCTVAAEDLSGNRAALTLTVQVAAPDTEAPAVCFSSDTIHIPVGTENRLTVSATDNYDRVEPTLTWSEGTFDTHGRFAQGTHTLTVTATDLSGNTATKTVTVVVTEETKVTGEVVCDDR